jgi:uncharacterized membrane protein
MELVLGLLGVVLGAVALGVALQTRAALARAQADLDQVRNELAEARSRLERLTAELEALRKKVDEPPPAPPLPRARHGGLDDLREQLRAAHAESAEAEEAADE